MANRKLGMTIHKMLYNNLPKQIDELLSMYDFP